MSRSGYYDDCDDNSCYLYMGTLASATRGRRGQAFFRDLVVALDAMPERRLIANELETKSGEVCALGSLGRARGIDMKPIDPEDAGTVGDVFNIAQCLARDVVHQNDEGYYGRRVEIRCVTCHGWGELPGAWGRPAYCHKCIGSGRQVHYVDETPEERWSRMREWAASNIRT